MCARSNIVPSEQPALTRGQEIWQRMRALRGVGKLSLERARLLTCSYKETEGLPTPIRRAKAFERILTEIPIRVDDEQLLVGDFASEPMGAEWYPELSAGWVAKELESSRQPIALLRDDFAEMKEICDYWQNRSVEGVFLSCLNANEQERFFETCEDGANVYRAIGLLDRPGGYHTLGYEKPIVKGFLGIIEEAKDELQKTRIRDDESFQKTNFLKGLITVYEAGIQYAKRYAVLAREEAKVATGRRKAELEKIAEICEWVPGQPARTFWEALQTMWFTHALIYLEERPGGEAPGRADQYLYPYYKNDMETGRITQEEAIELLECLRIKMSMLRHFNIYYVQETMAAEAQWHNITLGGQTPDGKDATNELSYLFLEAAFRTRSPHHTLSIRWHEELPHDFAVKAAELCSLGLGYPAFFNDDSCIPAVMATWGASLEEARGYAIGGCVVPMIPGKTGSIQPISFTMAKPIELAIRDGFDLGTRKQLGPKTGSLEDFETFDEFFEAYKKQVKYFSLEAAAIMNLQRAVKEAAIPPLFQSGLVEGCVESGKSAIGNGPRYQIQEHCPRSMIDTVDSLAALKKCVFDDKSVSPRLVIEALDANFEGKEDVRRVLLSAPKFGNDDDYVDNLAITLFDWWQRMVTEELDALYGHKYRACAYSATGHHSAGKKVGALPSGRPAGVSLADGSVSPCQGVDVNGPTALINSAGKIDQYPILATLLNVKFTPASLRTKADLEKLLALIKTYFHYGGKHIQFNFVDNETLLDAQNHPERHRNLLVRVAGYSAFFIELERGVQDEIIQRTEHRF
ncbi:MAG: pyruvate formate lyase family protein [Dehalococcoidia bacterium]